jgi:hypothetical protein
MEGASKLAHSKGFAIQPYIRRHPAFLPVLSQPLESRPHMYADFNQIAVAP